MVDIGDLVAKLHDLAFQRHGLAVHAVLQDAVADLLGQVQALAVLFQALHHADALIVVVEAFGAELVQNALAGVAEGRVPQIVPQRDGFGQVLV